MELPSSSSSQSEWKYDVFLSFRGEDTRYNFSDHLFAALKGAGIRTFRDNNDLQRGEEIGPKLLKSIEKSRFSIIIFSKSYASSTWCLDELEHIMKCRENVGQIVLPVFYDVEPSAVRKQKSSFAEAFAGHEDRFKEKKEKLRRWRDALEKAANLTGVDVRNDPARYESTIIDNIVKDISNKLDHKILKVAINPVGIYPRANVVKSLLYDESTNVRIVGIYGMGGIGKTTIAKEVYNSIVSKFDGYSFLANVREKFNSKSIVDLQIQLLSDILKGNFEKIHNSDRGLQLIEERLRNLRVLIVLDDVDKLEQIKKLLGNCDWLSRESRIIITTRIKDLLPPGEYRQYQVEELDELESLQLFSNYAFGECQPLKEYMEYSKSAVRYTGGIPLALEVLGSDLLNQTVDVWESKLEKLKKTTHPSVQKILEMSYHSLDGSEKDIFLDIACFFIGYDKNYIISILDGCGFYAVDGINTLVKRCLLKIDFRNQLVMHDLIRDMGRQIVFQECPKESGERSRVWHHKEAFNLLHDETGTKKVEGLRLNLPGSDELLTKAFKEMKRLRLLQLNSVNIVGSYEHISKNLAWLCWSKFPLESIPTDLDLGNVVALDMPYSSLKQLWEGKKVLGKLKILNLSHSHGLTKTSNLEGLPDLEILILEDCPNLVEVHESTGLLTKLVTLNLKDCRNLEELPRSICALRSLKDLNMSGCSNFCKLPEELGNMKSLVTLNLKDCRNLEKLPRSICALRSLEDLNMSGCSKFGKLPEELGNMKSLDVFAANGTTISRAPETVADSKNLISLDLCEYQLKPSPMKGPNLSGFLPVSLRELHLGFCNLSDDTIPNCLQNFPLLEYLDLSGNSFSRLPPTLSLLPNLIYLFLDECRWLKSLPELPPCLWGLHARDCMKLERINLPNSNWLALFIDGCRNLVEIKGCYKLEPVGMEIVKKLLEPHGLLTIEESIANVRLFMINNKTRTIRISPPQGLISDGIYSIFLPGSEIPSCCSHQSNGDSVYFTVSQRQGCKNLGFIICAVYASNSFGPDPNNHFTDISTPCVSISIFNGTKGFGWSFKPTAIFLNEKAQEDIMWLSYWSFENAMEYRDMDTENWRFKNEVEEGDKVLVRIYGSPCIQVKKCGVSLLYQQNDQVGSLINELTLTLNASCTYGSLCIDGGSFYGRCTDCYKKRKKDQNWFFESSQ